MGGGGGRTKVSYKAPKPDKSFEKYLEYQMEQDRIAEQRRIREEQERKTATASRTNTAQANLGAFTSNLETQLRSGLISYADAESALSGYGAEYNLAPGATSGASTQLANLYTTDIRPGRQATGVEAAYEELLGRSATEEEKFKAKQRFDQGYYTTVQDFKDSLIKGPEYQEKFNKSYLENYYDTQFGKQTLNEEGKRTGKRTFKFNEKYLPSFQGDLSEKTGLTTPAFEDFTGTPGEIEEYQQSLRQSRKFLYDAGLTNLQGEINKELTTLKTEAQKDVARTQRDSYVYGNLVSGFWN